jgi:hypothetical protein
MSSNDEIERLDAALTALDRVNIGDWPDWALSDSLDDLSRVLCRIDHEVARLAESVRSRGFDIHEPHAGPTSLEFTLAEVAMTDAVVPLQLNRRAAA